MNNDSDHFKKVYAYQAQVKDDPVIKVWLARVEAAVKEMNGVEVEFVTTLQDRCDENRVYHDHAHMKVAEFLPPLLISTDDVHVVDEETLPYYRVRFQDGVELIADDAELFSLDERFFALITAVSGAFAIAREMDFVGPWHLVAEGSEADKAEFLEEYQTSKIESPLAHWLHNHNTPVRFRQAAYEHYHSPEQRRMRSERATQKKEQAVSEAMAMCEAGNVDGAREHLFGVGMEEEGVALYLQSWL